MFGNSPHTVESNVLYYSVYFGMHITELKFNPVTGHGVRTTLKSLSNKVKDFTVSFLMMGLLLSILEHYSYFPFQSPIPINQNCSFAQNQFNIMHYFHPGHILNNLVVAGKSCFSSFGYHPFFSIQQSNYLVTMTHF